jgi:hypothetical protein
MAAWNACSFTDEWLVGMVAKGHSIIKIASSATPAVCTKTIQRRMREIGLELFTPMDTRDKEAMIADWARLHGYGGWSMLHGALLAKGFRLRKCEVKALLRAADPEASMDRSGHAQHTNTHARTYTQHTYTRAHNQARPHT